MSSEWKNISEESLKKLEHIVEQEMLTPEEIRDNLEVTEKGRIRQSIQNCKYVLEHDPCLRGAVCRNEMTSQIDIKKKVPWKRRGVQMTDTDMNNLSLYLEKNYGLTSDRVIAKAIDIVANDNSFHPIIDLLESLNRRKPVWVELGLQTANDHTAKKLNRCYPTSEYDRAVSDLHARGLEVITHLILGLPGETLADMEKSVRHAVSLGSEGMKLHLLHILRHTELEKMYLAGLYRPLEREEYIDLVCRLLPLIPRETVIHRMTGDGDKKELIAPLWSADKKKVLNALNKELERRDIVQGCAYDT